MRVRRGAALTVLYLVVGLFLILGPVRLDQARANEAKEQQLLGLINEYRQDNGVGPLAPSETLSTSAERHSGDMSAYDFFSHRTKESSHYPTDSDPADRIAREGYPKNAATAENIAWGQPTAEEVFQDWRHSPEHDAAMLDEQYTAVGVGHVDSYWTADFGSTTDAPPPVEIREPKVEPEGPEEPVTEEQTSIPQPSDERKTDEQEGTKQTTGEQTIDEEAQPEETEPTTEPGEEAQTTADVEQDGSRWIFDLGSEAKDLVIKTDTSTVEQTSNEETQTEEATPVAEPGEESASRRLAEQPLAGQTSISQPDPQQPAGEQSADEQDPQAEALPILGPSEEATSPQVPRLVPTQPANEGSATEWAATEETSLAEALRPLDAELTAIESSSTAPTQEGIRKASPVETEAMEAALTTRGAAPENPIRRAPSAPAEELPGGIPTALQAAPATLASGTSSGGTSGNMPVAAKTLPRTSGSLPLPLFVGGFLLLSGALAYGSSRKQRGR